MAAKKAPNSDLPLTTENDTTASAKITYANEVVAIIAGLAANEVEGIAGMCSISGNILNKNRNVTKGVKVEIGTEEVAVDLYVIVEYGTPIQRASMDAQENVRKAIESMTGLKGTLWESTYISLRNFCTDAISISAKIGISVSMVCLIIPCTLRL